MGINIRPTRNKPKLVPKETKGGIKKKVLILNLNGEKKDFKAQVL